MEEGTAGDRQQANETNGGERGLQSSPDELVAESHEGASSPEVDLRVRVESLKGEKKKQSDAIPGERERKRNERGRVQSWGRRTNSATRGDGEDVRDYSTKWLKGESETYDSSILLPNLLLHL